MDNNKNSHLEVMKAEVPGPVFGKVVSKLKNTAQISLLLVLGLVLPLCSSYFLLACPFMIVLSSPWGTAGTGGFYCFNDGVAYYNSSLITYLVSIGVLVFGVNL